MKQYRTKPCSLLLIHFSIPCIIFSCGRSSEASTDSSGIGLMKRKYSYQTENPTYRPPISPALLKDVHPRVPTHYVKPMGEFYSFKIFVKKLDFTSFSICQVRIHLAKFGGNRFFKFTLIYSRE